MSKTEAECRLLLNAVIELMQSENHSLRASILQIDLLLRDSIQLLNIIKEEETLGPQSVMKNLINNTIKFYQLEDIVTQIASCLTLRSQAVDEILRELQNVVSDPNCIPNGASQQVLDHIHRLNHNFDFSPKQNSLQAGDIELF